MKKKTLKVDKREWTNLTIQLPEADNEVQAIFAIDYILNKHLEDKTAKSRVLDYVTKKNGISKSSSTVKKVFTNVDPNSMSEFNKILTDFFGKS